MSSPSDRETRLDSVRLKLGRDRIHAMKCLLYCVKFRKIEEYPLSMEVSNSVSLSIIWSIGPANDK